MAETPPEKKSKYTTDRRIPGAFEGETVTRRRVIGGSVQLFGAHRRPRRSLLPALGFALGPIFEKHEQQWNEVGALADFPDDTYVPRVITLTADIGEVGKTTVYLRRRNPEIDTEPADKYNQVVAISTRCMHLGCPVRFVQASAALHLPVPRRRLRLQRRGRRRPAGAPARPLLHRDPRRRRLGRPALQRELRARALLPAVPG